jgi:monothiol glutaredoxin
MALAEPLQTQITDLIAKNRVVLFMKGTRSFPQCGFSATVVQILDDLLPGEYHTVNVLKEADIREGIKAFSNWPTIPQLYVDGKFVGGCDIVREMYVSGELQSALGIKGDAPSAPTITLTEAARTAIAQAGQPGAALRLSVSSRFEYELSLDEKRNGDFDIDLGSGLALVIDRMSAKRADGIRIDYSAASGGGFRIDNPNEPAKVKGLQPAELKAMLTGGEPPRLVDVRTEEEYGTARIAGGVLLDAAQEEALASLPRDTAIVFYCHHGMRSRSAAERYLSEGFTRVYNLEGGIDAWSKQVDPSVPRY